MSDDENDHGDGISFGDGVTMHMDTKLQAQMDEKNKKVQAKRDQMTKDMEDRLFKPDRLEHAKSYANSLFKEHKMKEAGAAYERLLPLCVDDEKLTISILSNLAAVRIREWKWKESLDTIDKVLDIDPNHAKAMYRQAQAFRGMRELELALKSIASSRTATDPDNKPALTELDSLESAVTKEIDRRDREAKERKESQERKARRMKELANKQSRKVAAQKDGSGLALPPAECGTPTGDVGQQTNWAQWFYKQLSTVMCDEENRYMIHEEDGWMEVIEAPETKCEIVANVKTNANGERFLHYELNCVLYCMVTQFRAPADAPGALGFHVNVYLKNIDNLTPPDEWICYVDYCKPGDYKPATRIKKMMEEYVRPTYVPYIKELTQGIVDSLIDKVSGRTADPKAVKANKPEPPPDAPKLTPDKIARAMKVLDEMDAKEKEERDAEKAAKAAAAAAGEDAPSGGDVTEDEPLPPPVEVA